LIYKDVSETVIITLRAKIYRAYTTRLEQQLRRRFAVKRLKSEDVATQYRNELESELQSAHDVQIKKVVVTKVSYSRNQEIRSGLTRNVPRLITKKSPGNPNSKQNQSCKAHSNE
jgi:hypothetical protein